MDRRAFTKTLSLAGLGLIACRDSDPTSMPHIPVIPDQPASAGTAAERAQAVVKTLLHAAEETTDGVRWGVLQRGERRYLTDLYTGQAGIVSFLAAAHRATPAAELRVTLEKAGTWLQAQPLLQSQSLLAGNAGLGWAYLDLNEALSDAKWMQAAAQLAPAVAQATSAPPTDMISGLPGQGLFLLRLAKTSGNSEWLTAAQRIGDAILSRGVRDANGLAFAGNGGGNTVFYPGMAHGCSAAGYLFARLAADLPAAAAERYLAGGRDIARWLEANAVADGDGLNWPMWIGLTNLPVQWCHGAPGIGVFFAEMYAVTREAPYLEIARKAAAAVASRGDRTNFACQCHGIGGNAELFLKLHRLTSEASWLDQAKRFGDEAWAQRTLTGAHPEWHSGDTDFADNKSLLTGHAGTGWFYLDLASAGALGGPITS